MTEAMINAVSKAGVENEQVFQGQPQTPTEKTLAQIWSEILNLDIANLTVESDFFDVGGNSLTIIKLLARIQEAFGEDLLSPDAVFENGQLAQMAASIDSALSAKPGVASQG